MRPASNRLKLFVILLLTATVASACGTIRPAIPDDAVPVLAQDELIRPYTKLGRIIVTREVYGTDYSPTSDMKAWGIAALRHEADKMGADAVILPEITGQSTTSGVIPSTEYRATGFAIKFK